MTKDDRITSHKYSVLHMHENTIILLIPVKHLTYPEPSTASG